MEKGEDVRRLKAMLREAADDAAADWAMPRRRCRAVAAAVARKLIRPEIVLEVHLDRDYEDPARPECPRFYDCQRMLAMAVDAWDFADSAVFTIIDYLSEGGWIEEQSPDADRPRTTRFGRLSRNDQEEDQWQYEAETAE